MKRFILAVFVLLLCLSACNRSVESSPLNAPHTPTPLETKNRPDPAADRQIRLTASNGTAIIFTLNNSNAARSLYSQLPLTAKVEKFGSNEKIFYPREKLTICDAPLARGPMGTLAYYAPWGNVAIFYGNCDGASGLYALGIAVSGAESIQELTGIIRVEAVDGSKAPGKTIRKVIANPRTGT